MDAERRELAEALLSAFAERTGLGAGSARRPRRYLWTDAFAVCTWLGLGRVGDGSSRELASRLVDQVHHVLGRHRADDARTGWLSGLPDAVAEQHPTRGGLRIGKPRPERAAGEPVDPELEWEQDGQYFHYLTKWMHALDQVARWTGSAVHARWACELAEVAQRCFTTGPPGRRRMVWKMSVDLSRPLIASMGQHDPVDGLVTCIQLRATIDALGVDDAPRLGASESGLRELVDERGLATIDPLGIGGLLVDGARLAQLGAEPGLTAHLFEAAGTGLRRWLSTGELERPAERRLAFRELGLALGLAAVEMLEAGELGARLSRPARTALEGLAPSLPARRAIEAFWIEPRHRGTRTWQEHEDIDDVMLAATLAPRGFLDLGFPGSVAPSRATAAASGPAAMRR